MTDHTTTEEARRSGRCWCGHVRMTHHTWAAGEFCTRLTCGCRHYAEKRRGGEVIENRGAALPAQESPTRAPRSGGNLDATERIDAVLDSIEAIAHGQGALAAAEWGLGDRRESYVTNAATRNLLKGLVRAARAAQTGPPLSDVERAYEEERP